MGPGQLLALLGTAALSCWGLDLETPTVFRGDPRSGFGASVAQFGSGKTGRLLVGAPRAGGGSGAVFGCSFGSGNCQKIPISGPPGSENSSLGLALAAGGRREICVQVCGPASPQVCGVNVHLNGFCVQLDPALRPLRTLPGAFPECPSAAMDIAFLVDGSGSIAREDFESMKAFVGRVMGHFRDSDTQVNTHLGMKAFVGRVMGHFRHAECTGNEHTWDR
uniref:integrin alpha-D-like n=1 Tax=Agelaius phoeniceus TaxID=39638 RepID=UPI0023EE2407|nr:integrin alpha-D-like [Agelaius phoeniceus]